MAVMEVGTLKGTLEDGHRVFIHLNHVVAMKDCDGGKTELLLSGGHRLVITESIEEFAHIQEPMVQ